MAETAAAASVRALDAAEVRARRAQLVELIADAVDGGASIGYVLPCASADYAAFWDEVADAVGAGERFVLASEREGTIVGTIQLAPCTKANGRHRAEVQKLMVLRAVRGEGIGGRLMREIEALARGRGHRLLLLDTRADSSAERLYRRLGWHPFGSVPDYASDPDGTLADCVFFFKRCDENAR